MRDGMSVRIDGEGDLTATDASILGRIVDEFSMEEGSAHALVRSGSIPSSKSPNSALLYVRGPPASCHLL